MTSAPDGFRTAIGAAFVVGGVMRARTDAEVPVLSGGLSGELSGVPTPHNHPKTEARTAFFREHFALMARAAATA